MAFIDVDKEISGLGASDYICDLAHRLEVASLLLSGYTKKHGQHVEAKVPLDKTMVCDALANARAVLNQAALYLTRE